MIKTILVALGALILSAGGALAQSSPNLSYGQVPTAGQWNSYFTSKQDYPISTGTITSAIGYTPLNAALAPSHPNIHPASGNLTCSLGHYIPYTDENWCLTGDTINWTSNDPSALFSVTLGGSVTTSDQVRLTFTFPGVCVAGCQVSATATGGDTLTTLAVKLATAIRSDTRLYNLGVGGYDNSKLISYVPVPGDPSVHFDWDSRVTLQVVPSVTGSATETLTIANTGCGVSCSNQWDNNPVFATSRFVSGMAPPANSQIFAIYATSNDSAHLTSQTAQYGVISNMVLNSTAGAISSRWGINTPDVSGNITGGVYVGRGLYGVGSADYGINTVNFTGHIGQYFQFNGSSSGNIVVQPQAAAGSYNFNLPTTAGASGSYLTSGGGASAAMTWSSPAVVAKAVGSAISQGCVTGVNVNTTNTDTAIALPLPNGTTRWQANFITFSNPSISLTTATAQIRSASAGGGSAILGTTALSPLTTNAANTAGSSFVTPSTIANAGFTMSTIYLRTVAAQGAPATVDMCFAFLPLN